MCLRTPERSAAGSAAALTADWILTGINGLQGTGCRLGACPDERGRLHALWRRARTALSLSGWGRHGLRAAAEPAGRRCIWRHAISSVRGERGDEEVFDAGSYRRGGA